MAALERIERDLEKDENIILGHKKKMKTDFRLGFGNDILSMILLRLPVASVLRVSIVCKQWRALISDPYFVKLHLKQANKGYYINYLGRVAIGRCLCSNFVPVTSINNDETTIKVCGIACPSEFRNSKEDGVFVMGSCDGLLLLTSTMGTTFLWNPSTRKWRAFMDSNFKMESHRYHKSQDPPISGLGYDVSRDEYKGVVIEQNAIIIFSSKSGKWKKVECDIDYRSIYPWLHLHPIGITVNGALHWIRRGSFKDGIRYENKIMYFDVGDEKIKMLSMPNTPRNSLITSSFSLLEGCICVVNYEKASRECNVWVMKESSSKNSWTKLFVIPTIDYFTPLGYLKEGELVLWYHKRRKHVRFNAKTRVKTNIDCFDKHHYLNIPYVETLVSP